MLSNVADARQFRNTLQIKLSQMKENRTAETETVPEAALDGDTQPEVNRRKVVLLAALMALVVCGALWWLDRRPRRVRLVVGGEGCAAVEGLGLPVERAAEGGGCVVNAVLLPGSVFDSLAGPPHSMYRLRPPSEESAVTEVWLKKHLALSVTYDADHKSRRAGAAEGR